MLLWSLRHLEGGLQVATTAAALGCLVLGSVVSYAKARAEAQGFTANIGLAERADRLVVVLVATLLVGLGLPAWVLTIALVALAVASAVTVVQRMVTVRRQWAAREATPAGGPAADTPGGMP